MALSTVRIRGGQADSPCELLLELDTELFTQQLMLDHLQLGQLYEQETMLVICCVLKPGDTFLDIGGHVGFVSTLAAGLVGPSGRVFTFEPEQRNYERILRHVQLNQFHHVFPAPWAVGQSTVVTELFFNLDNDGGHALWDPALHPFNRQSRKQVTKRSVLQVCLDDLFRDAAAGHTKLIKIDTEGNEVNVLRGAQQFLRKAEVPGVIAEVNRFGLNQMGSSEQEMRSLMADLGYVPYLLKNPYPQRLQPDQFVETDQAFNLLFARPALAQLIPQMVPPD